MYKKSPEPRWIQGIIGRRTVNPSSSRGDEFGESRLQVEFGMGHADDRPAVDLRQIPEQFLPTLRLQLRA